MSHQLDNFEYTPDVILGLLRNYDMLDTNLAIKCDIDNAVSILPEQNSWMVEQLKSSVPLKKIRTTLSYTKLRKLRDMTLNLLVYVLRNSGDKTNDKHE